MKSKLALGSAPAVSTPFLAAGVTSPTSLLSVFLHHRPKRIDARGQAKPIEARRHLVPSFADSPQFVEANTVGVVLILFMALLPFVESAPQAYRLKESNAASPISTFSGAIPDLVLGGG